MIEVRWHGRGGNGSFTAAKLLGYATSIYENKYAQAFPSFGPERRGAPVLGFTRVSDEVITDHSQVYSCDCVVVLDETLCEVVDTTNGLKEDGYYIINTARTVEELRTLDEFKDVKNLIAIDATGIALEKLGMPIVNTVLLGVVSAATKMISIESVEKAIGDTMAKHIAEKNRVATRYAYDLIMGVAN